MQPGPPHRVPPHPSSPHCPQASAPASLQPPQKPSLTGRRLCCCLWSGPLLLGSAGLEGSGSPPTGWCWAPAWVLEALWAPPHRCRYLAPHSTCPRQAAAHAQTQTPPHHLLFTHHFLHQKQAQALPMTQPPPHTCHSLREVLRGAEPGSGSTATALLGAR